MMAASGERVSSSERHLFSIVEEPTDEMRRFLLAALFSAVSLSVLAAPFPQAADDGTGASTSSLSTSPVDSSGCISYDGDGFAPDGRDRAGYDGDGLDQDGFGRNGFNTQGLNRDGLDKAGKLNGTYALDKDGYDSQGYNLAGRNKDGFNALGFDRDGYDAKGYDRNGYDKDHRDRNGNSCSSTSSDSSSANPSDLAALGLDLPDLQDKMGALPIDTAAFVGDAQPTGTDSGGVSTVAAGGGQGAGPTAAARA
ncbi:hypothetical protein JCM8208_001225 [Rhodotorula glutinis]